MPTSVICSTSEPSPKAFLSQLYSLVFSTSKFSNTPLSQKIAKLPTKVIMTLQHKSDFEWYYVSNTMRKKKELWFKIGKKSKIIIFLMK